MIVYASQMTTGRKDAGFSQGKGRFQRLGIMDKKPGQLTPGALARPWRASISTRHEGHRHVREAVAPLISVTGSQAVRP